MKTFMEHVLTPAAKIVWSVNGIVIDAKGEHDLSPKIRRRLGSDRQRRGDAGRGDQRADDPAARARSGVEFYAGKLAEAADQGLRRRGSPRPEIDLARSATGSTGFAPPVTAIMA